MNASLTHDGSTRTREEARKEVALAISMAAESGTYQDMDWDDDFIDWLAGEVTRVLDACIYCGRADCPHLWTR